MALAWPFAIAVGATGGVSPTGTTKVGERQTSRDDRLARLVALSVAGALGYGAFQGLSAVLGQPLPDAVVVGVPFLVLPAVALWWWGEPAKWGALDRGFVLSAAVYAPFAVWVVAALPGAPPAYFAALPTLAFAVPGGLLWAFATFMHVGAVDYFTKRIVQHECEALWGPRAGQGLQLVAWTVGHIVEWLWLRDVLGEAGAAVFLVAAGVATGWAYARWKNVAGLMVGHLLVNVAAAVAALAVYG